MAAGNDPIVVRLQARVDELQEGLAKAEQDLQDFKDKAGAGGESIGKQLGDEMAQGLSKSDITDAAFLSQAMLDTITNLGQLITDTVNKSVQQGIDSAATGFDWAKDRADGIPSWQEFLATSPTPDPALIAAGVSPEAALRAQYQAQYEGNTAGIDTIRSYLAGGPQALVPGSVQQQNLLTSMMQNSVIGSIMGSIPGLGAVAEMDSTSLRALEVLDQIARNTAAAANTSVPTGYGSPAQSLPGVNGAAPSASPTWSNPMLGASGTATAPTRG